jgi:hypothetical protein
MLSSNNKFQARHLLALLVIGLSVGVGLALGGGSSAARVAQVDNSPLTGSAMALSSSGSSGKGIDASSQGSYFPYHYLVPQPGGPCNGCTVHVGDRFTLDLMVHSGHFPISAQQAYLTFPNALLQNVSVPTPGCVLAQTMQADLSTFDTNLQNEQCNGPAPCFFRGILTDPGSMAYASGSLESCRHPNDCQGDFRVAAMGLCATAPGQAILRWQFSPPAPPTRNTEIFDEQVPPCACPPLYVDYVINVIK